MSDSRRPTSLRRDPGLWLLLHLRPPHDRRSDVHGTCSVCGRDARFVLNSWILSSEVRASLPPGATARESLFCSWCGSSLRVRRLAAVLVQLYRDEAGSIAELVEEPLFRELDVAEINGVGRMHAFLARLPRLAYSEFPDEDITALSYPDASYDLVLTSETLEHVPDPMRGLRETKRVLRPGGRHVFTVPVDASRPETRSRTGLPAQHHGRGGGPFALVTRRGDMLVHTDFGADLPQLLRDDGWEVEVDGNGIEAVFVATRPEVGPAHGISEGAR